MAALVLRRLLSGAVTLALVVLVILALVRTAPGIPGVDERSVGRGSISPEAIAAIREMYHLDDPPARQFTRWLGDLARGDLGRSLTDRRPVREKIGERLGPTALLGGLSLALMFLLALPAGAAAAMAPGGWYDRGLSTLLYAIYAMPIFWAGLLLQMLFAVRLEWLPLAGFATRGAENLGPLTQLADRASHLVLPVACLTSAGLPFLTRFVRATLLSELGDDGLRAARARGVGRWRFLVGHAFRRAAVPLLTLAGLMLPLVISGSFIVERIFNLPGLGTLFVESALARDLPVVLGITLLSGVATLTGVVLADLAYALFDPRIRRAD